MISNTASRLPKEQLSKLEAFRLEGVVDSYMLLSNDYKGQREDPELYPGLMTDKELE